MMKGTSKGFLIVATVCVAFFMGIILFNRIGHCIMLQMSLEELTKDADSIVIGSVIDKQSKQDPTRGIKTDIEIKVKETIKGAAQETVIVEVPGGEVGEIGLRVSDAPELEIGEKVLLFLKQKPEGVYIIPGLFQGKFSINAEGVILENKQPLDEFKKEIKNILQQLTKQ